MPLVDLSQTFRHGMFSQKLFPPIQVQRCIRYEDRGVNVTCTSSAVHAGTHVDAPCHFVPDGLSIDQLDLTRVSGPAVCWRVESRPDEEISVDQLERCRPAIEPGDIVFLHTGWDMHFRDDHDAYNHHPYLSSDAAEWLVEQRVEMLAIDAPTPDMPEVIRGAGFNWPVHHLLLGAGVLIAENLAHLELVSGRRFRALALPIPIAGSDGAPARIVAET